MRFRAIAFRIVRITAVSALALFALLFGFIQGQQRLLRHRAERLLADFRTLQPDHSTWSQTQVVMAHWHHWGYSVGDCTPAHCSYTIDVPDTVSALSSLFPQKWQWTILPHIYGPLRHLGYRFGEVHVSLTVIDGTLRSEHFHVVIDHDGLLLAGVQSQSNLGKDRENLDYAAQMSEHPDYFVGSPTCTGCIEGWIYFVPHINPEQVYAFTNFQLDCFTRRQPCELPQDLLPFLERYHLYDEDRNVSLPLQSRVCNISPVVFARDAAAVVVVDTISTKPITEDTTEEYEHPELDTVSLVAVLKGKPALQIGSKYEVFPFGGEKLSDGSMAPENLEPGQRYILFMTDLTFQRPLGLDQCGVLKDSPENRANVAAGISQDDGLDSPDTGIF